MKKLLLFVAVLFCIATNSQETKLLASCCDAGTSKVKTFGRCSGDASCSACSNCKYCKHCAKEGGSCGVCAVYETPKPRATGKARLPKGQGYKNYPKGKMLEVQSETLKLRQGPGTNHDVIEELSYGAMVTFVRYEGEWLYVRVDDSGNNGWVYNKFVK